MKKLARKFVVLIALTAGAYVPANTHAAATLNISPVEQQKEFFCWLAVGEMIFKYYSVPAPPGGGNYQCGALEVGGFRGCPNIAAQNALGMQSLLYDYPRLINHKKSGLISRSRGAISFRDVKREIDNGRPVIAGINPGATPTSNAFLGISSAPQHAVLIIGYTGSHDIIVADPFRYPPGKNHPYFKTSSGGVPYPDGDRDSLGYRINYDIFREKLRWTDSIDCITFGAPYSFPDSCSK